MGKKTGQSCDHTDSADRSLVSAAANSALLLEEATSVPDHAVSIALDPVIALDGGLFIRRTPLRDRILRVVEDPVHGNRQSSGFVSCAATLGIARAARQMQTFETARPAALPCIQPRTRGQ
ncbi:hypothetical protein [Nocardia sp. GTS18]|uniref:hypothetical protein n=1 Tax=Nocardia sp. GTS18 TaxID=1778064 RepID=UPI0015EF8540|nr:hypothetical protein [Nocardia sp. GTS18]